MSNNLPLYLVNVRGVLSTLACNILDSDASVAMAIRKNIIDKAVENDHRFQLEVVGDTRVGPKMDLDLFNCIQLGRIGIVLSSRVAS